MTPLAHPPAQRSGHDLDLPFAAGPRVRRLADYASTGQGLDEEQLLGVAGARVVFANYAALRADFAAPWQALAGEPETAAIDRWLLENAACISASQAAAQGINTPIALDRRRLPAWRPPRYGRAAVLCAAGRAAVLFDVKGLGVPPDEAPVLPHSNGLLTLGEAVHEVLMEHLVFAAMHHAGGAVSPLPAYALIDLGFDALWLDGRAPEPAVLLVRRPCTRPRCQWQRYWQGPELAGALLQAELLLRRYGLTASSCGAVRFQVSRQAGELRVQRDGESLPVSPEVAQNLERLLAANRGAPLLIDGVNVQLAGAASVAPLHLQVMDFGRYRFAERFEHHLYAWVDADYQNLNGVYLAPDDPRYVQPDPALSLAGTAASPAFAELQRRVRDFRQGVEPERLCQALRATLETACRPLRG
ncbi:hypothetical protein [Pseudomonas chlororaphis]|uniref:Uncharacterized protein n=1 Tax=Pseudomonas chlororaphis TaxID=587753 RepID=A0A1Q8EPN5_9PSED|nr:hypothetical protein [Pseudomonas chlororaphis]OLF53754.1 hypothetical protein BTN82_14890 [Pseudomonas chlororaphis]